MKLSRTNSALLVMATLIAISAAFLNAEDISKTKLEDKYTDSTSRFIQIDGNRVHYRDEGDGPVVVLLHGTASSLHTWDEWAAKLKTNYRVIRMDLPGFGLTGPERLNRYEVDDDVRFLSDFLNALNVERIHLAGSSLGGRIAWQYALENPESVTSLTLLNALGYPQQSWPPAIALAQVPVIDFIMAHVAPRPMYNIGLKEVYFDPALVTDTLINRYYELSRYPGNLEAFTKRVKASLDKDASLIPNIRTPTLILWGEKDLYFPVENAYRFNQDIPNSEVSVYKNVGHLPMEEAVEQSLADLERFLKQSSGTQRYAQGVQ